VPVSWSTAIPPGIVLQADDPVALVSLSITWGGEKVFPPSFETVT